MMRSGVPRSWRDAACLVAVSERASVGNLEVLLQTRPQGGSFKNSVVFPGGVSERVDTAAGWLHHIASFGYSQADFDSLYQPGTPVPPILQDNPVLRHVSLRITAIRETFEELGVLVCSRQHKQERSGSWAQYISDFDVKYWQNRISRNPEDLLTLCTELKCYPDIWSLHYWSNWLSPPKLKKRFDTAFFLTALKTKPDVTASNEVVKVEWRSPQEVISDSENLVLYPPQAYELCRLGSWGEAAQLATFAKETSSRADPLYYHASLVARDGIVAVFPGDELYPESVDYDVHPTIKIDKTVEELRNSCRVAHRIENIGPKARLVLKNFSPKYKEMEDRVTEITVTYS